MAKAPVAVAFVRRAATIILIQVQYLERQVIVRQLLPNLDLTSQGLQPVVQFLRYKVARPRDPAPADRSHDDS